MNGYLKSTGYGIKGGIKMKYKFIGFKDPVRGDTFWLMEIKTVEELINWYKHFLLSYYDAINRLKKRLHPSTILEKILYTFLETIGKKEKYSISDIAECLDENLLITKIEALKKHGMIYINENGAYFPDPYKLYKAVDEKILDKPVFPQSSITITKWSGGTHFYIGDVKFNSLKEAVNKIKNLGVKNYVFKEITP